MAESALGLIPERKLQDDETFDGSIESEVADIQSDLVLSSPRYLPANSPRMANLGSQLWQHLDTARPL